ncbi:MAG: 50S ribosomal protein L11 methyltransferase [Chloroflexota bacterium]|jgi:ribosomal protein L11 methyltransferase|nr:50S ribosomal protein L11 methyltransferase [Chloroflexota bacterium]
MGERWLAIDVVVEEDEVDDVQAVMARWAGGAVAVEQMIDAAALDDFVPDGRCRLTAYLRDGAELPVTKYQLFNALWMLGGGGSAGLRKPGERWTEESEWMEQWKRFYRPLAIGRVGIVPAWDESEIPGAYVVVSLDPGQAFGTGLHVSTRQALLALQQCGVEGRRVLDLGTGSGILAIAAAGLGAAAVVGLDTDARAVDAARENVTANDQEARIELGVGTLGEPGVEQYLSQPFDIVVANIVAAVHCELALHYPVPIALGGHLILGGIVDERADLVTAAMAELPLALAERIDEERWVNLVYTRTP